MSPSAPAPGRFDALLELDGAAGRSLLFLRHGGSGAGASPNRLISLAERSGADLSQMVSDLGQWSSRLEGARADTLALIDQLGSAARERGASLRLLHAWPTGFSPREPWRRGLALRSSPVLPWLVPEVDVELVALELGLRRLVKREGLLAPRGASFVERCRAAGLMVAETPDPLGLCFVARSAADLDQALAAESALRVGGEARAAAVVELGELLGYPSCCTRAFAALEQADDFSAAVCRLPPWPARGSPFGLWLDPSLRLVSHLACALDCGATARLASALFEALAPKMEHPGMWRDLADRVHVVDAQGGHVALRVEPVSGSRTDLCVTDARTVECSEVVPPRLAPLPELRGLVLEPFLGGLRSETASFWAVLVADHRSSE